MDLLAGLRAVIERRVEGRVLRQLLHHVIGRMLPHSQLFWRVLRLPRLLLQALSLHGGCAGSRTIGIVVV